MPVGATALVYSDGTNTSLGMLQKSYVTHTAAYTAVAGDQIFCDTKTTDAFTVTLPAGAVNDGNNICRQSKLFCFKQSNY